MKLNPIGNRVLLKRKEKEGNKKSIILIETSNDKEYELQVVAVGLGESISVKIGDIVMIEKYCGQEVKVDDESFVLVKDSDIIGIFNE